MCLALGLLVVLGIGVVAGGAVADSDRTVDQRSTGEFPQVEEAPDPDATVTRIDLHPNGTAVWSLTVRMRLDSNESVEGFEAFEDEFEANRSRYLGQFRDRMTGVIGNAETVTEREMAATEFDSEIGVQEVPRRWGYVAYQFRWEGFAAVDDGVTVGDVFRGGLFLDDDDVLIIEPPTGYEPDTVDPAPDETGDSRLQWNGPVSFDDQRPQVRFVPADSAQSNGSGGSLPTAVILGSVVVLLVGLAAVYTLGRDSDGEHPVTADRGTEQSGAGGTASEADPQSFVDDGGNSLELDELATDEDRVIALLEAEAGRMRQADIADRLDWSASKTSRVISELAADDAVEKLRIGRENVIDLGDDTGNSDS
ncbi:helix-turn-helix transcriptional regulator [Natrialbaceae archaeon GCM10025896]